MNSTPPKTWEKLEISIWKKIRILSKIFTHGFWRRVYFGFSLQASSVREKISLLRRTSNSRFYMSQTTRGQFLVSNDAKETGKVAKNYEFSYCKGNFLGRYSMNFHVRECPFIMKGVLREDFILGGEEGTKTFWKLFGGMKIFCFFPWVKHDIGRRFESVTWL